MCIINNMTLYNKSVITIEVNIQIRTEDTLIHIM